MKPIITALLIVCLFPFSAYSQEKPGENEFTLSAHIRPRAEYRNGVLWPRYESEEAAGFINNRARLSMGYKRDGLSMKMSAQHVGVWGQDPQIDKNGRFILNEAWARLDFNEGFFAQLGRQSLVYDDERILGGLDWNVAGRFHDALKLGYENPFHKLHLILAFNQNDEKIIGGTYYLPIAQPYKNMQTLWYNFNPEQPFTVSFLLMNLGLETGDMETQDSHTRYLQTMGTFLTFAPGNWKLDGSFYYQTGKNKLNREVSAFMASLRGNWSFSKDWNLILGTDYLSGSESGDKKMKAFDPLYGTHHKFYGAMDYFYASAFANGLNPGLWDNQVGLRMKASPKIDLSVNYHYFLITTDVKNNNKDMDKGLGSEIDFQVDWSIMKDVKLSAGYSFMLGTETIDYVKGGNHKSWQDWGWISLNINPRIFVAKW